MAKNIAWALSKVKDDLSSHIREDQIIDACREIGYQWRDRLLGPIVTVYVFVEQLLAGNTAMTHLRHLTGCPVKPSAYCQARQRLPLELFRRLTRKVCDTMTKGPSPSCRWHGHRTFAVDGSAVSMPDTDALRAHFGQPGKLPVGCGFPVAMIAGLWDMATGLILDVVIEPWKSHPMSHVGKLGARMERGDLLVGDRGFCSYAHLALVLTRGMHALFRMHQMQIVDFRPGRRHTSQRKAQKGKPRSRWMRQLGHCDQVVTWLKPAHKPRWMSREEYAQVTEEIEVRELRYRVEHAGFRVSEVTLVTTLLDERKYPAQEIAQLYGRRWEVETNLRYLKQTLKMDVLKSKSVEGVLKEIYLYVLVYNLVRLVMIRAGQRQGVDPDRISFVDAWRWLQAATPDQELTDLVVNPRRVGRFEPRVRKRRPKNFRLMTRPRGTLKQSLVASRVAS